VQQSRFGSRGTSDNIFYVAICIAFDMRHR
jgi:hypothetical protein